MRIRGQSPVVWRTNGQSQIGVDPHIAQVLAGLTDNEQELLTRLSSCANSKDFYRAARATGTPMSRAQALLTQLSAQGTLIDADAGTHPRSADEYYWERIAGAPAERFNLIAASTVAILGSGAFSNEVALLLAEAGVGTILSEDASVQAKLAQRFARLRTYGEESAQTDLAIVVDPYVIDPIRERALTQAGIAHLPVTISEVDIRIGPLFAAPAPVCRSCLELWACQADPHWPAVATQARTMSAPAIENLLLHQAATTCARAALQCLVAEADAWHALSVSLNACNLFGTIKHWQPHPQCVCATN